MAPWQIFLSQIGITTTILGILSSWLGPYINKNFAKDSFLYTWATALLTAFLSIVGNVLTYVVSAPNPSLSGALAVVVAALGAFGLITTHHGITAAHKRAAVREALAGHLNP